MTNKKAYIIVYRVEGPTESIKTVIKSLGTWMSYFNNFYIVITDLSLSSINDKISNVIVQGKDRVLIVEANLSNNNGWLPSDAWDWIRKNKSLTSQ